MARMVVFGHPMILGDLWYLWVELSEATDLNKKVQKRITCFAQSYSPNQVKRRHRSLDVLCMWWRIILKKQKCGGMWQEQPVDSSADLGNPYGNSEGNPELTWVSNWTFTTSWGSSWPTISTTSYDIFTLSEPWAVPSRHSALEKAESILVLSPTLAAEQPWPCFENRETPATVARQCGPWARRGKILSPSAHCRICLSFLWTPPQGYNVFRAAQAAGPQKDLAASEGSGWSPVACEGFHTNLNIPSPLPITLAVS